ncbi:TPA_asm: N [Erysimum trirhavirus 1]|nr:TPA_asm: N [Erysimum trirhavirus 1]
MANPISIFSMTSDYSGFNGVKSQTKIDQKPFSAESYKATPVELNWYYVQDPVSKKVRFMSNAQTAQVADVTLMTRSFATQNCSMSALLALIRLTTNVTTGSGNLILPANWPETPIVAPNPENTESVPDNSEAISDVLGSVLLPSDETPKPVTQPPVQDDGRQIQSYSFLCAFLMRFAYRRPAKDWESKMKEFKNKFTDMMGYQFSSSTPSRDWVVSFNSLAKDLKHKFRIIVHMVITKYTSNHQILGDHSAPKMFRYLFATPLAYFGMNVMIQIRQCAESLDIEVDQMMSALTVSELQTGLATLKKILTEAVQLAWWPYARAFDDSYFMSMSNLSVRKVHFVTLTIVNMKGGQANWIDTDALQSLETVRDKPQLEEVAAKIVAAVDMTRPSTTTSDALKMMETNEQFRQRAQRYIASANDQKVRTINRTTAGIDLNQLLIR